MCRRLGGDDVCCIVTIVVIAMISVVGALCSTVKKNEVVLPQAVLEDYEYCLEEGWDNGCYLEYNSKLDEWEVTVPPEEENGQERI